MSNATSDLEHGLSQMYYLYLYSYAVSESEKEGDLERTWSSH